jgi:hypothetical protein
MVNGFYFDGSNWISFTKTNEVLVKKDVKADGFVHQGRKRAGWLFLIVEKNSHKVS